MHVGLPYGVFLFSPSVSVFFRSHEVSSSEWEMRGKRANCDAETATTLVAVQLKPSDFPSKTQRFPPHFAGNSSVAKTFLPRQLFALCLVYEYLQRPFSALLAHFPGPCPHPEFIGIEGSSTGSDHRTKPLLCTWKNICCNLK